MATCKKKIFRGGKKKSYCGGLSIIRKYSKKEDFKELFLIAII